MKKLLSLALTLMIGTMLTLPVAHASEDSDTSSAATWTTPAMTQTTTPDSPKLPEVYDGGTIGTNSRKHYTEETRPEDSSPLNSVTDNPEYGNEVNFLTITNTATGAAWRAGTMELIPGDQYLVEVYCRNDCANTRRAAQYTNIQLKIEMPYQLGMGDEQPFGARLTVEGVAINIYTSVNVVAREAVSLLYVTDTAKTAGDCGTSSIDYRELFGEGTNIIPSHRLSAGNYQIVSFIIQVLPNEHLLPVDDGYNFEARLSPAGTGFTTTADESIAVGGTEVASEAQGHDTGYYVATVIGSVIGLGVIVLVVLWWRKNHGCSSL